MKQTIQPTPNKTDRKSVKQMVKEYRKDSIILPLVEFRDDYEPIPALRTKTEKPIPAQRTKIELLNKALKNYPKSFEIAIKDESDPLKQFQSTRKAVELHLGKQLNEMKGLKFLGTLVVTFHKQYR